MPSVDLLPRDREKEERLREKQMTVLNRIKSYFDNAEQKITQQATIEHKPLDSKFNS